MISSFPIAWLIEAEWRIYALLQHTNIASDNGLVLHQCVILSIRTLEYYFSEILFEIWKFSLKQIHLKLVCEIVAIWLGLKVLGVKVSWYITKFNLINKMYLKFEEKVSPVE